MKQAIYLLGCFVLLLGSACALTNYELITDDEGNPLNTKGKAIVNWDGNFGTLWPDGMDELFAMVDQKANGDRTITNYNHFTTDATFIDWLYCSPDWNGCSFLTADDPEIGDVDPYDYTYNANCSGFRSLFYLINTTRYSGECGRARIGVEDRIKLMNMGSVIVRNGVEGLLYNLNRNNFSIRLDNNSGVVSTVPMVGDASFFVEPGRNRMTVDMTNSLLANTGRGLADYVRSYGTEVITVTFTLNGVSKSWDVGKMNAEKITENVNKIW